MIRALVIAVLVAVPAQADEAGQAAAAVAAVQEAIAGLGRAKGAKDRVKALTALIAAEEAALADLRDRLRQARLREDALTVQFNAERARVAQLLGVLAQLDPEPGPRLLLHPEGPTGTVRAAMILSEVTPALQAEAERLRRELEELAALRQVQTDAAATISAALAAAQEARTGLSQAISDRTDLPKRFEQDAAAMAAVTASAETIADLATGLVPEPDPAGEFAAQGGKLPAPVRGTLLRRAGEADAAGVARPGLTVATAPGALVTAPWAATIRYRGPLSDYGNVMILEPGSGYLLVLAGFGTLYGEVGEVVAQGAPLGLMGGADTMSDEFPAADNGAGVRGTETLYIELRRGTEPVDPAPWFAAWGE
jgi:septal ring factor EnvC (AmiA/AmiB activator)